MVTFLEISRYAGRFYNKEWNSPFTVLLNYYCALIEQIEESGFKERNQLLDTPCSKINACGGRVKMYEKYLKVQYSLCSNEKLKSWKSQSSYGLVMQTLISQPHSHEKCSSSAHPHNNSNYVTGWHLEITCWCHESLSLVFFL